MLNYEVLHQFRKLLEQDQEPTRERLCDVNPALATDPKTGLIDTETAAYDEKRRVFSINFEPGYDGRVTIKCHVQWEVMEQLMVGNAWSMTWSANQIGDDESLHLHMELREQPDVEYTTVLFKCDVKALWKRIHCSDHPYPDDKSIAEVWEILYNRGVWEM